MAHLSLEEYMQFYDKNPTDMARILSAELSGQGRQDAVSRQNVEGWLKKDDYAAIEVSDIKTGKINSLETTKRRFIFKRQVKS